MIYTEQEELEALDTLAKFGDPVFKSTMKGQRISMNGKPIIQALPIAETQQIKEELEALKILSELDEPKITFLFTDPKFIGKSFILEDDTVEILFPISK